MISSDSDVEGEMPRPKRVARDRNAERRTLLLSVFGSACMTVLGIGFALYTHSMAIVLDVIFSFLGIGVAFLALGVARIVRRADDRFYQFGYAAFESFFNFVKGILIAAISLFALVSSVLSILQGGRPVSTAFVSVYATTIAIICFAIAIKQTIVSRRMSSLLVKVDAKNWIIDGIISTGIALGFFTATLLGKTRLSWLLPYSDPVIVILILLGTSPISIRLMGASLKQLLLGAPAAELQKKAQNIIDAALVDFPIETTRLRAVQVGRYLYLHLIVLVPKKDTLLNIDTLDHIRDRIYAAVTDTLPNSDIDVYFTRDRKWVL
jgi:predicted Co/Zn/Cd cation transporter (cation efflux family)